MSVRLHNLNHSKKKKKERKKKKKKRKEKDFCRALSQEITLCSPCLPGQARVDGNSWNLAGSDTVPESKGPEPRGYLGVKWMLGALSYVVLSQTVLFWDFFFPKFLFVKSLSDHLPVLQDRGV